MAQRESLTIAGAYCRASIYPVRKSAKGRRRAKAQPTREVQEKLNEKNRQNHFADLVHANFVPGDYFITLTYRDDCMPHTPEDAKKDMQNFFRRIKARLKKEGKPEAKYLYVTERGSQSGRVHHHAFIACELDRDELEKLWGKGYANSRRIEFDANGVQGLVRYSLKSGVKKPDEDSEKMGYRTYSGSKNLTKPKTRQNDYRIRAKDAAYIDAHPEDLDYVARLYPDYVVTRIEPTPRGETGAEDKTPIPRAHFITIWMYRADANIFARRRN